MEKILLRQNLSVQWKAVFALAVIEALLNLLSFRETIAFSMNDPIIQSITMRNLGIHGVLSPLIKFSGYALVLAYTQKLSVNPVIRNLIIALCCGVFAEATHIVTLDGNSLPVLLDGFIVFLIVWVTQTFTNRVDNRLLIFFLSILFFAFIGKYLQINFLDRFSFPRPFLSLLTDHIRDIFTLFIVVMWFLSLLKIQIIYPRDPEVNFVNDSIKQASEVYLNKEVLFAELKEKVKMGERKLAKIFTKVPDPSYKPETVVTNTVLAIILMIDALYFVAMMSESSVQRISFFLTPFSTLVAGLLLALFIPVKLVSAYGVAADKPWGYWLTIVSFVCINMCFVYALIVLFNYLSVYPRAFDRSRLWIIMAQMMFNFILAFIAFRIVRKLFMNYRPFGLKRNETGDYEL